MASVDLLEQGLAAAEAGASASTALLCMSKFSKIEI